MGLERLYTSPPQPGVLVCLDEMGPTALKSTPGPEVVRAAPGINLDGTPRPAARAKQAIETGSRGRGGYIYGAFRSATGEAFTRPYEYRRGFDWVDFLEHVEAWI